MGHGWNHGTMESVKGGASMEASSVHRHRREGELRVRDTRYGVCLCFEYECRLYVSAESKSHVAVVSRWQ